VRVSIPEDVPPALADADRLEDVLANLVGNALKFSPPDKPVRVAARAVGSSVEVAVRDNGPGIAPAEQERIFDRFYQVHRGPDRRAGGSGLGLYIVRGYVTAMNGSIRVESALGHGSTFTVTLPAADAAAEPRLAAAVAAGSRQ
jgi:signal transduction histidine kinase